ncbi:MAG: MtnX-like HAD-IB family phosphatase [Thermoanaerobacteraceae bacterium]|nr:MtnX-like HAD-IB family phosphatase [Thermoanaerobacteraceae bacterium]
MERVTFAFFIDFDGTITRNDVCETLVTTFAGDGWQEINRRWEQKELSTVECARQTFKLFTTSDPQEIRKILDNIQLDASFKDFVSYCKSHGFPIYILSDGYDFYIDYLLEKEGIELPYYANKLIFSPEMDIEAPYQSADCDLCGVCKTKLMQQLQKAGQVSVYIGDGYSDFCPAKHADYVFAKKTLYRHCTATGREVFQFATFSDVLQEVKNLIAEVGQQ